jgi:hypothetical protein
MVVGGDLKSALVDPFQPIQNESDKLKNGLLPHGPAGRVEYHALEETNCIARDFIVRGSWR